MEILHFFIINVPEPYKLHSPKVIVDIPVDFFF